MRLNVTGRNIEVTPAIKDYVNEKIGRVVNHYDQIQEIEVTLSVIKNPSVPQNHTAEVTCKLNGGKLRVEESAESMYASIDLVADKLDRQVTKHKDKNLKGKHQTASIRTDVLQPEIEEEDEEETEE